MWLKFVAELIGNKMIFDLQQGGKNGDITLMECLSAFSFLRNTGKQGGMLITISHYFNKVGSKRTLAYNIRKIIIA